MNLRSQKFLARCLLSLKMSAEQPNAPSDRPRPAWWRTAGIVLALAYAVPVGYFAYNRLQEVSLRARQHLIVQYQLWEMHPEYQGTPQMWTRVASWLLTDTQLMRRVRVKYGGELTREIELDYQRDLTLARAEVVLVAAAAWALPVGALYGLVVFRRRRRRPPPEQPKHPVAPPDSDSRYRP